ncbi:MAG: glycosyl hydrolase [Verrucomicrobiae bacterium]|nr:glycosyl hydrolase [Verrucomicrobiae bacterium]
MYRKIPIILGLAVGLTFQAPGQALLHRYSFTSDATDSVGTANGTAMGGATFNGGGALVLNGATGYVSLPPGLVSNLNAATIETWATFGTIANNTFLFGFGNTDTNGAGANYLFCTPHGNGTRAAITAADPGWQAEQQAQYGSPLDNQSNILVTTVFNPPAHFIGLYLNGVLVASNAAVTTTLASVSNKFSYLGRSLYTNDPYLSCTLNEFRIYNGALTNGQIAVDAAAGPDRVVTDPGDFVSWSAYATNMTVNSTQLPVALGNYANVTNLNLFAYGQPAVISGNTNIATVNAAGVITALALGSVGLTISNAGQTISQLLTITFPTNRFVFDTFGDGFWTITNAANGKVLTVNATGAGQAPYTNGATEQQYELLYNYQNSTFRIRQHSSWLCLGSKNGGTSIGTGVTTVNYAGTASQQWYLVDAGNGRYRIVNKADNYALQTDNGSPETITLAAISASPAQLWGFSYQTHYPKKGCAGYEGDYSQFGLNWAYNYNDNTGTTLPASVVYEPMIHDANWEPLSDVQSRASGWRSSAQPVYLLTYNEPDNTSQANMNTNTVIGLWPSLQNLNVPLVSPACATTYGSWAYNFFTLIAGNNYRVDYTAAHMYQAPAASSLIGNLQNVYSTWGRPVWLTEFSPVDWNNTQAWSENDNFNFLAEFMWMAEDYVWFKRYAIFPFSGTPSANPWDVNGHRGDFFLSDGATLTPYGELYATWDANRTVQTRTPYFIHNLATSFRLTATNSTAPLPANIRIRDASTQWAFLPAATLNRYYIISLKDGRRLRDNAGTPDLAPVGTTGPAVEWWFNGPDSKGYYYVDNTSASQSIRATGTAPAISLSMINDPAPSTATQWRLVKPYQPVAITTAAPPVINISYSSQSATLTWAGNGSFYNVYRSTTSGGAYSKIASLATNLFYTDNTLQNGTAYFYVVTALNLLGEESANSAEVIARPASLTPQALNFGLSADGLSLQFNWPSDHTGWRLLVQTNNPGAGLSPNPADWMTLAGSASTNQISLPVDAATPAAFYRLVYP